MDIPEIRAQVGLYLHEGDLKTNPLALAHCASVCKAWRDTFIPLLYGTIDTRHFSAEVQGMARLKSLILGVQHHGRHLKKLTVSLPCPLLDIFATSTGNIKRLSVIIQTNKAVEDDFDSDGTDDTDDANEVNDALDSQQRIRTLLNSNLGIDRLFVSLAHGFRPSRSIGQIVQHCLQLKELQVYGGSFDLADLFYLHGLSRLFYSPYCRKQYQGHRSRTPSLPSLTYFELSDIRNHAIPADVEMISNLPHLERLSLSSVADFPSERRSIPSQIRNALEKFQPSPQLSNLTLESLGLTDQDLARVFNGCPTLASIRLVDMHDGEASFTSLVNLAGTLTNLTVLCEKKVRYWTPQRLLCSLPKLQGFSCGVMDVDEWFFGTTMEQEILLVERWQRYVKRIYPGLEGELKTGQAEGHSRGRWICKGIQALEIETLVLSLDTDRNKAFMDQLGDLQDIKEFFSLNNVRQVVVSQESDYYSHPVSALMKNGPRVNDTADILQTSGSLCRCSLMQDSKTRWIPTLWPEIHSYWGPCQPFTEVSLVTANE